MTEQNKDQYKETVFLPKTDFPMRGGLPQKEPEILKKWQEMNLYGQLMSRADEQGKKPWILHDGPPYANGNIHMGHALNKILKDVIIKSRAMTGYKTPYVPGWDCHGLPIEWKIEEKYRNAGKDKDEVDILDFRDECRKFAGEWVETQSAQFQRLGVTGDWETPYLTMRERAEGKIVREIHKFALNGLLYKGAKPVMWSVVEKTALAEAEVEYKEHKSVTIWVRFPVKQTNVPLLEGADVVIWTTTPWTIPSNRAIAFGEGIEYGVYQYEGGKIAMATSLAEGVKAQAGIEEWECLGTFDGVQVSGTVCKHPLATSDAHYDAFDVPVLQADFVTDDAGTGFVHCAAGHGEDDFNLVRAENARREAHNAQSAPNDQLPLIEITDNVADDGKFRPHVGLFAGMEVYTQKGELGGGNFAVLKALTEVDKLLAKGSVRHEYPHSWRSKAPLIFRTTPQWFIAMDRTGTSANETLRDVALGAIKETNWYPSKGETRITSMIENRPDWCISRQRAWGVPIALFLHKETGEVLAGPEAEGIYSRIGDAFEAEGADCWWHDGATARFLEGTSFNPEDYDQVFDIVDVWFESGSTHAFVVGDDQTWPHYAGVDQIDLYLEGSDQHRGWFHSSLLESCGTNGRAPYKNVLTHGFVLDEKGYKMSKSLGNVVDPLKMMEQYGADILRLWVMLSDTSEDIRIGKETMKNTGDLYRRIRNTLRFLLGAMDGFTEGEAVDLDDVKSLPALEQLMLHRLHEVDGMIRAHIEKYEFSRIAKLLHDYCNEDLSAFYFDIRKDTLYCDAQGSDRRRACRTVLVEIFSYLTAWMAPILSFTAEEAWSHRPQGMLGDEQSVHLREFPSVPASWQNDALAAQWTQIKAVRKAVTEAIEPLRASKELGSSLEAHPVVSVTADQFDALQGVDLAEVAITSQAKIVSGDTLSVQVEKAEGGKCARCWQVKPEVSEANDVCDRCAEAVAAMPAEKVA